MKRRDVKRKRRPFSFILVFLLFAVCIVIAGFLSYRIYEKRYRVEVER
jgi:peptidoglycan/LPS O-acetylase OafA/YrhL